MGQGERQRGTQQTDSTRDRRRVERRKKEKIKKKIKADMAKYLRLSQRHTIPTACTETYYFVHNKNVSNNNRKKEKWNT